MNRKPNKRSRRKDNQFKEGLDEINPDLFWQILRRTSTYIKAINRFETQTESDKSEIPLLYRHLSTEPKAEVFRERGRRIVTTTQRDKPSFPKFDLSEHHQALEEFQKQFGLLMQFPINYRLQSIPITYFVLFNAFQPIWNKSPLPANNHPAFLHLAINTKYPKKMVLQEASIAIEKFYEDQTKKDVKLFGDLQKLYSEDFEKQIEIWDARQSKMSWGKIATQFNVTKSNAENSFKRVQQLIDSLTSFVKSSAV